MPPKMASHLKFPLGGCPKPQNPEIKDNFCQDVALPACKRLVLCRRLCDYADLKTISPEGVAMSGQPENRDMVTDAAAKVPSTREVWEAPMLKTLDIADTAKPGGSPSENGFSKSGS